MLLLWGFHFSLTKVTSNGVINSGYINREAKRSMYLHRSDYGMFISAIIGTFPGNYIFKFSLSLIFAPGMCYQFLSDLTWKRFILVFFFCAYNSPWCGKIIPPSLILRLCYQHGKKPLAMISFLGHYQLWLRPTVLQVKERHYFTHLLLTSNKVFCNTALGLCPSGCWCSATSVVILRMSEP